jgi:hypothetical protein
MTVITVQNRETHINRMRSAHRNAITILLKEVEKTFGYEQTLLKETADYHMMRLHHQWFGTGRRENGEVAPSQR